MKSILISIKPKYVCDTLNGKKTREIRKTCPHCDLPIKVYIYCTKDKDNLILNDIGDIVIDNEHYCNVDTYFNGKVVACFTLNKVEEIFTPTFLTEDDDDYSCDIETLLKDSCLNEEELINYIGDDNYHFFAWHISNLEIFDTPKELSEFEYLDKKHTLKWKNKIVGVSKEYFKRPPQSWCYVED